jgi:hypothetical protein
MNGTRINQDIEFLDNSQHKISQKREAKYLLLGRIAFWFFNKYNAS